MNEATIRQWFDIFKPNGELVEVRVIPATSGKPFSGYFTDVETLLNEVRRYERYNVYFTLNRINDACYSREQRDKISERAKSATSDHDIVGREWILIDVDIEKPSDTNSTDEEKKLAQDVVNKIYKFLRDEGFEKPVVADSANGYHLLLKCSMLNSPENTDLVKRFLQVIDLYFSTEKVKVDCSTFNASRVCKLYGTYSRKGADTVERPQRESKFVRVPSEVKQTAKVMFEKVAGYLPKPEQPSKQNHYNSERFDLDEFIAKHGIAVKRILRGQGYDKYILDECPFNSSHKAPDSAVFRLRDGSYGFRCFHNSCSHYTFRDFRQHYEPYAYEKPQVLPHRSLTPMKPIEKVDKTPQEQDEKGNVWQKISEIEDEDRSKIVSIPSGIEEYDRQCCGFDKPSLSLWSGNNGSAKSTLLNQLALIAVSRGFKVAIYSGELRGKKLKRWLTLQAGGNRNEKSHYNEFDYFTPLSVKKRIEEWLEDKLYVYNTKYSHDIQQICTEVEQLVSSTKVDMLILDNLSSLDIDELGATINEQQKDSIKMLLRLTEKLEIATHLVVHPKKSEGFLRKNDVSGVKTLTDLADNVFFVHRWDADTERCAKEFMPELTYYDIVNSKATNIVEVIKHREFGEAVGKFYKLYFEAKSRRLKNNYAENVLLGWEDQEERNPPVSDGDLLQRISDFEQNVNTEEIPF